MLRESLPTHVEMGVVRYIDYATARLPSMSMFEYIMHKDTYYGFEREVRAVATPPAVKELGLDDFKSHHFESEAAKGFFGVRAARGYQETDPRRRFASAGS